MIFQFLLFAETSLMLNASNDSPDAAFTIDKDTFLMNLGSLGHKIKSVDEIVSKYGKYFQSVISLLKFKEIFRAYTFVSSLYTFMLTQSSKIIFNHKLN